MASQTKSALANALKDLLSRKPLEKITVSDISSACGVNRQTFYYYFHDVYDLIDWIYNSEGKQLFSGRSDLETWQDGLLGVFDTLRKNQVFVTRTFRSRAKDDLVTILQDGAYRLIINILNSLKEQFGTSEDDIRFIADFYKYAFAGTVLDWIANDMQEDPAQIVSKIECLMGGRMEELLQRFKKQS